MVTEVTLAIVLLFGVRPTDPATVVVIVLLLTTVALLACHLQARRAAKVDPKALCATVASSQGGNRNLRRPVLRAGGR